MSKRNSILDGASIKEKPYFHPKQPIQKTESDLEEEEILQWAKVCAEKAPTIIDIMKHSQIMFRAGNLLQKVLREHPEPRNSIHEALGFIEEEMHELRMEVFKKTPRYRDIADEAYDVMITCARLIAFCNDKLPQEFLPDLKNKDGKYPGHEDKF